MFSTKEIPSPSSLFSFYASVTTSLMLIRSVANEIIPHPLRSYLLSRIRYFFKPKSPYLTLIIDESTGISRNQVYDAAETYLCTKVSPKTERLKVSKTSKDKNLSVMLDQGEKIVDYYDGIELKWRFVFDEAERNDGSNQGRNSRAARERKFFELTFHNKYKDVILGSYLPDILEKAKGIREEQRVLKMHTINGSHPYGGINWDSINLEHPATFETLAMEPERKKEVTDDLNRFINRKEFYKRVGRAWKRGYLLYGPPGTGKSSLVAAMANHLKFDVYDLQLANIMRDADLRRLLLTIGNRSILVIEDIDCSVDLPNRREHIDHDSKQSDSQLTLSGLLNFIDGLWSSCGDERIIIFTTNNKDRLDPALLRPGRMDVQVHMSYCRLHEFKILVSNYLGVNSVHHTLFGEIGGMLGDVEVTPAEVAEELLRSDDPDVALQGLVKLLKRKKLEGNELVDSEIQRKKQKLIDNKKIKSVQRKSKRRHF